MGKNNQQLIDVINQQHSDIITIVSIFIAIILAVVGFIFYFQLKFSKNQIVRMEKNFKKDFKEDFNITGTNRLISKLESKNKELGQAIIESKKMEKRLTNQIDISINQVLESKSSMLDSIDSNTNEVTLINRYKSVRRTFGKIIEMNTLDYNTFKSCFIDFQNSIYRLITIKYVGDDKLINEINTVHKLFKDEATKFIDNLNKIENIDDDKVESLQELVSSNSKILEEYTSISKNHNLS